MKNKVYRRVIVRTAEGIIAMGGMFCVIWLTGNAAHLLQVLFGVV